MKHLIALLVLLIRPDVMPKAISSIGKLIIAALVLLRHHAIAAEVAAQLFVKPIVRDFNAVANGIKRSPGEELFLPSDDHVGASFARTVLRKGLSGYLPVSFCVVTVVTDDIVPPAPVQHVLQEIRQLLVSRLDLFEILL